MKKEWIIAAVGATIVALAAPVMGIFGVIVGVCVFIGLSLITEEED